MFRACLARQINEVESLKAMFCGPDELTLWNQSEYDNLKVYALSFVFLSIFLFSVLFEYKEFLCFYRQFACKKLSQQFVQIAYTNVCTICNGVYSTMKIIFPKILHLSLQENILCPPHNVIPFAHCAVHKCDIKL